MLRALRLGGMAGRRLLMALLQASTAAYCNSFSTEPVLQVKHAHGMDNIGPLERSVGKQTKQGVVRLAAALRSSADSDERRWTPSVPESSICRPPIR